MTGRMTAYITGALDSARTNILNAQESTRNITLNTEAFGIGQLVGSAAVPAAVAQSLLLTAAMEVGLDREGALRTIQSGLGDGAKSPRDLSTMKSALPTPNGGAVAVDLAAKTAAFAKKLYKESYPILGSLGERYLRETRGLTGDLPICLRYHPGIFNAKLGNTAPALVAPITHADATTYVVSAAHVTQIDPATLRKIATDNVKRMFGACKGGAVWLGQYARHMLVAEGIEKALACMHATGIPTAAGLSSTIMPSIVWPTGTQKVTICADPNKAGEVAIIKSATNYTVADLEVYICYPPEVGKDWDECDPELVREAIITAKRWNPPAVNRKRSSEARAKILSEIKSDRIPEFERNERGNIVPNEFNSLMALYAAGISIAYNEFAGNYTVHGLESGEKSLTDAAVDDIFLLFEREFGLNCKWTDLHRVLKAEGRRKGHHPIREYLDGLEWDEIPRIDEWLCAYGGAADTLFTRAVARIVLVAAVRRVRDPGCKFDEMLVLESAEGKNKSSALRVLAGAENFSDDAPINEGAREVIERLRGKWIVECADLKGMRKTAIEHLKSFLSRQVDTSSMKYDVATTNCPRQCIFIGTTNEHDYLISPTGSRRFWPVAVEGFDIDALAVGRDQLWAEAAHYESMGESIRLPQALWTTAQIQQEEREEWDEWDGIIATWLKSELADLRNASAPYRTSISDVAEQCLDIHKDKLDSRVEKRIGRAMRRAGWKMTHRSNGKRYWQLEPSIFRY